MRSKKLVIGLLLLLAVVFTTGTFAYWASGVAGSNDSATGTITIGEGNAVSTTVTVGNESAGGPLVPIGFESGSNVNNVDLLFDVDWDGDGAEGATGTLVVTVDSVEVDGVDKSGLFTIDVSSEPSITAGTLYEYTVNVEFTNEPENQAEYNEVATKDVIVTLTFTVSTE